MAAWTFREKKRQQSRVFFDIIFYAYTRVGDEGRTRAQGHSLTILASTHTGP